MCGFLVMNGQELSLEAFDLSLKKISNRGPDASESYYAFGRTWGFNRLSIMDLSKQRDAAFSIPG